MRLKLYLDKMSDLFVQNKAQKFAIWMLLLVNLVALVTTMRALTYQKTVLVPILPVDSMTVSGSVLGPEYVMTMTRLLAGMALNYTPATADSNFQELLKFYSVKTYDKAETEYRRLAREISKIKITQAFYLNGKILLDEKEQTIRFEGIIDQKVNGKPIKNETSKFTMTYEVIQGRFYILELFEEERKP